MKKAEKQKPQSLFRDPLCKTMIKLIAIIVVAASLLLNLFTYVTPVIRYYGDSMSPTLKDGQILVVNKLANVKEGDVVAFYYNNNVLVRRVVATENQQISIDIFGTVSVNGAELNEPYVENKTLGQCDQTFPYTVLPDSYFVLGDNRAVAMDSRLEEIGVVAEDRLIGKVMFQ